MEKITGDIQKRQKDWLKIQVLTKGFIQEQESNPVTGLSMNFLRAGDNLPMHAQRYFQK